MKNINFEPKKLLQIPPTTRNKFGQFRSIRSRLRELYDCGFALALENLPLPQINNSWAVEIENGYREGKQAIEENINFNFKLADGR